MAKTRPLLPGPLRRKALLALFCAAQAGAPAAVPETAFGTDAFGLPQVDIRFLNTPAGPERTVPIPNGDFAEQGPDGLPESWSLGMSSGQERSTSVRTLPGGERALVLANHAIVYSPRAPVEPGWNYRLSFSYSIEGDTPASVRLNCHDAQGKIMGNRFRTVWRQAPAAGQEGKASQTFAAPNDATAISFTLFSPRSGTFEMSKLDLRAIKTEPRVDAKIYPWSFVDGRFALIQEELTPLCVSLANPREVKPENPRLILELPHGVRAVGGIYGMPRPEIVATGSDSATWSVPIPPLCLFQRVHGYPAFFRVGLFAACKAAPALRPASYYYQDDRARQPPEAIGIAVLPPLPPVAPLRQHVWAAGLGTADMCFDGAALELWADLIARSGFNAVTIMEHMMVSRPDADRGVGAYYRAFHKRGARVFVEPWRLGGKALDMGYWLTRPLDDERKLTWVDGTKCPTACCPTWTVRSPLFRKKLHEYLRGLLVTDKRGDALALNWEPWPYFLKSCFDERCLRAFAGFLGRDPKYVDRIGPKGIVAKHRDEWIRFRNQQLGDIAGLVEQVLRELEPEAGAPLDLMPYVTGLLSEPNDPNYPGDVGRHCRLAAPFLYPGRHFFLTNREGVNRRNRFAADMPVYTRRLRHFRPWARAQNPERPPKLYKCSTFDVAECIETPAQLRQMALLEMAYGCQGTIWYRFTGGYDGRYYHAFARICNELARLEPCFAGPELENAGDGVAAEGWPAESVLDVDEGEWNPDFIDAWMVKGEGRRIVSIANMQERWNAEVHWRTPGIPAGEYCVHDPLARTQMTLNGSPRLTDDALSHGFHLKLRPNDIRFRVIEPWPGRARFDATFGARTSPESQRPR